MPEVFFLKCFNTFCLAVETYLGLNMARGSTQSDLQKGGAVTGV